MFASPLATVAKRNLTHHSHGFVVCVHILHTTNLGSYANRAGSISLSIFQTKNARQADIFYLEAWVGIEPASKDLQSSA